MCKLVNDPRTALEFYPVLKPVLEKGIDEIAVEEVRKVCENSLNTLKRVSSEATTISDNVITYNELKILINEKCNPYLKNSLNEKLLDLITLCCHGLVVSNNRKFDDWNSCLYNYLYSLWSPSSENINEVIKEIYEKGIENLTPDKVDPEDEEEDLCNAQFSLAYGTRVLLHQTPFRVKIGRKMVLLDLMVQVNQH